MTDSELLKELSYLQSSMISVATGGAQIQSVQTDYGERFDLVAFELTNRGIENPLEYRDLWVWFGRWKQPDLPTYQLRRAFVAEHFSGLIKRIQQGHTATVEPTGWERVDRALHEAKSRLAVAKTEEQFQAIGLLCREILISTAQSVFDPLNHPTLDEVKASTTDAKRMLEAYIAKELNHSANEYVRKHAKAALDLALNMQHKRTATFRDTGICLEATSSVVNVIAVLAGRRYTKSYI